ncbi:MAG: hypothetical protein WCA18_01115, partial [Candidatus Nanoarchaeia archaeon]
MKKGGGILKKQAFLLILLLFFVVIINGSAVSAGSMPIYVKPLTSGGFTTPGTTYNYTFNWTTDSACNNVVFSNSSIVITTGSDGTAFINLTIPDTLSSIPSYLCEYRNGTLRQVHTLSTQFFNQVYSNNINSSGNINASGIFYGNGSGLSNVNASLFNGYNASFFMPLNTSVVGNFNFNGGWTNGGLSIIGGSLYSNGTVYSVNFSNLNVSNININGSFLPYSGYDSQFNLGNATLRWNNLFIGGSLYSNGTLYENSVPISTEYYGTSNPNGYYNSTTLNINASGWILNWNGSGLIQNWSSVIASGGEPLWNANYSNFSSIYSNQYNNYTNFSTSYTNALNNWSAFFN